MAKVCFSVSECGSYVYDSQSNIITTLSPGEGQGFFDVGRVIPGSLDRITWGMSEDEFIEEYHTHLKTMVLQITQDCNLRCTYCAYSGAFSNMLPHSRESMSADTAHRAIDFFMAHSRPDDALTVIFYGGEPLLKFEGITEAVAYANTFGRTIKYGISTNGTLLSERAVRWLAENPNVLVTVTVNGDAHDRYRVFEQNRGSLDTILARLNAVKTGWPQVWENQIRIITNIWSYRELDALESFFRDKMQKLPVSITHISMEYANDELRRQFIENGEAEKKYMEGFAHRYIYQNDDFLAVLFREGLDRIHNRGLFDATAPGYIGSCAPLIRRMFVRTDGAINLCEKVSDRLSLGNVFSGFDDDGILSLFRDMRRFANDHCRDCWAQRLCTFCYQDVIDGEGRMLKAFPEERCLRSRKSILDGLKRYILLMNVDPERTL